jgi:predicted nucleic-acid-binding protein
VGLGGVSAFGDAIAGAYASEGPAIELGRGVHEGSVVPEAVVRLPLAMMNRHGLVAGATGTGKTKTLQVLAEQLSAAGVPVFCADVKGDVSGLAAAGDPDPSRPAADGARPGAARTRASAVLAGPGPLLVADLVVAECVYVLESFYEVEPERVAELMRAAIALPSIRTVDAHVLIRALALYETERLDFDEAYLVAQAETTGVAEIVSFDRSTDRVSTVSRREP